MCTQAKCKASVLRNGTIESTIYQKKMQQVLNYKTLEFVRIAKSMSKSHIGASYVFVM